MSVSANAATESSLRWWELPGVINQKISGVFEGGGAKGVLYAGALRALCEDRCWFSAVAGSSAGAITATLIAAGMTPDQIEEEMDGALKSLEMPRLVNGILRLRRGGSYLNQEALLTWLRDVLKHQTRDLQFGDGDINFKQLFDATGIELNIVAADLSEEGPIVFNHIRTPKCQIAQAVVASAAIPGVFEWMPLTKQERSHIIVDGGVAANFPMFVFTDRSFRKWADLPEHTGDVVGFLLDEKTNKHDGRGYEESVFSPQLTAIESLLGKRKNLRFRPRGDGSPLWKNVWIGLLPVRLVVWPFWWFFFQFYPWFLLKNSGFGKVQTWDKIENRYIRNAVRWVDRVLLGAYPWGSLLLALLVVTSAMAIGLYEIGIVPLMGHIQDIGNADVSIIGGFIGIVFFVSLIAIGLYAWVIIITVLAGATMIHRTARVIGFGLLRTFLNSPGAPQWTGKDPSDKVVRLAVPNGITTLGVDHKKVNLKAKINEAAQITKDQLSKLNLRGS